MKNFNKTISKFSIEHFEIAKLKNSKLILGGDAPVQYVTSITKPNDTTEPSQTNTTRTSIAVNLSKPI